METQSLEFPDSLKQFVQERIAEDGYNGVGEYVRELILADRKRKQAERLDDLLIEGLESGEPIEATPEFWAERKRKLLAEFGQASG